MAKLHQSILTKAPLLSVFLGVFMLYDGDLSAQTPQKPAAQKPAAEGKAKEKRPAAKAEKNKNPPAKSPANEKQTPAAQTGAAPEPPKPAVPLGPPIPEVWSPLELQEAAAECERLFRGKPVEAEPVKPMRDGVCGAPAPMKVKGFSLEPAVEIRPAATMTCKMTMAVHEWVATVLQPRAKELLHANIIRISNVASYHCRHRYNDPMQRMSNHAFARALDISEFMTAKGEIINVLEHWALDDERARFLKEVHAGACKIFGTTLGPEANEAHANHFHFDDHDRRKGLCDFWGGRKTAKKDEQPTVAPAPPPPPSAPDAKQKETGRPKPAPRASRQ